MRVLCEQSRRSRPAFVLVVLLALALLSSCANKQVDAAVPTAPAPVATARPSVGPLSVPQTQVDLPPAQPVPEAAIPPRQTAAVLVGPTRPDPEQSTATVPNTSTPPAPQRPPAVAVPQLGRLLSAQQRREYNREISQNVLAADASLDILARQRLSTSQRSGVARVRAFLAQVEEARGSDLELARSLSDRARLLAEDMVRNLPR